MIELMTTLLNDLLITLKENHEKLQFLASSSYNKRYINSERMSSRGNFDYQFKLVIIGDTGVGKSCILTRFADNAYTENYISTIGVDFRFRTVKVDKKSVKLQIWDTAGQERFKTITSAYYRGADGIILAFDVSNQASFYHVQDWLEEVNRYAPPETCKLLIGNKCDIKEREVSTESAKAYADALGVPYLETSAKINSNVDKVFLNLTSDLLKAHDLRSRSMSYPDGRPYSVSSSSGQTTVISPRDFMSTTQKDWQHSCCQFM